MRPALEVVVLPDLLYLVWLQDAAAESNGAAAPAKVDMKLVKELRQKSGAGMMDCKKVRCLGSSSIGLK